MYSHARQKLTQGIFDSAIQEADQGYRKSKNDSVWSWKFRILKAEVFLRQGDPAQALDLLSADPPAQSPVELSSRRKILQGEALCRLGRANDSAAALAAAERFISPERQDLRAELALTSGRCALSGNRANALRYFLDAANLAQGGDGFIEGTALLNAGWVLLQEHRYGTAIEKLTKSLRVTDSAFVKEKALGNLGLTYSEIGEGRRAIPFSQQAENLASQIKNKQDQTKWLIDLGREHLHQVEYSEAQESFGKALKLARDLHDEDDTAISLHDLAQLALRTKDWNKAEDYVRQLQALRPKGTHYLDLLLNRAALAKERRDFPLAEQLLSQLLEQIPKEYGSELALAWTAQSDLAAVYAAQGKVQSADKMFRQAVASVEATRSKIEGIEYRISFLDYSPFYDQYVRFLVSQNRPLEALAIAEQGRSPTLSEGLSSNGRAGGIDIRRIQGVLKRDRRVVLAYWLAEQESYLWVITPAQMKLLRLPVELEIEKELEAYNREIIDGGTLGSSERAQNLYKTLVGPAEPFIPKGSSVIIVPHRKLYNLNFETLVVQQPRPHYWIEDVALHHVSFLSALTALPRPRSAGGKALLLVGAPQLADEHFPVLKYAPAEMERVAAHFPAAQEAVISGKDATAAAYLASNPGRFRLLHFVTHGTSSTVLENPLDSAIILSPTQGDGGAVSDPQDSYRLYGKDIMKTPLHADLVTVSACYGMGREYSGEGLVGLAWAFLRAGAHQVVAALWEVDDASTPQLMDDFYAELSKGKSATDALRTAKLKMLHAGGVRSRPYYWASLQLYTGS